MAMAGLYRRILPSPPAIDFASTEGKKLLIEGIQNGTMEGFCKLISHFQTQSEPAYCGLASLSMVLNALAIDPGRTWKGPWRWYDESMLDCCEPLEKVKAEGISFGKLVCLARCAGARVSAFQTHQSSIDSFRNFLIACCKSEDCHVVSSYDRRIFKQTGTGHFSPIGGYHAGKDMALILDVARFKYPPHWVPLTLLWKAMDAVIPETGERRGFILISRNQREPAQLFTLSCKEGSWTILAKYLIDDVPLLLMSEDVKDIYQVLSVICMSMPSNFRDFIKWVAEVRRSEDDGPSLSQEEGERLALKEEILKQVQETDLCKYVAKYLSSEDARCVKKTILCQDHRLPDIVATICREGAEFFSWKVGSSDRFCCRETCVKSLKDNGGRPVTIVSGTVIDGAHEQDLEAFIPVSPSKPRSCSCPKNGTEMHPAVGDVLTVLLLALPLQTWSRIKDNRLGQEILSLMSTENLPSLLQHEILHLRRQLLALKGWKDNKIARAEGKGARISSEAVGQDAVLPDMENSAATLSS